MSALMSSARGSKKVAYNKMVFSDINLKDGLNKLEFFLEEHSFLNGYTPTKTDLLVFENLKPKIGDEFPHVQRWIRNINSYSVAERAAWSIEISNVESKCSEDDIDLFGSDEEDDEAAKIREERVAAYAAKKSKKPALIAKSSVLLDVKPWDDETDMKEMETCVRSIVMDGLLWGASKLVPVGYGIKKLQIMCVIEDEKVSIDLLTEKIEEFENYVQSVDIAAFNKI